jgi:hypothetical protein
MASGHERRGPEPLRLAAPAALRERPQAERTERAALGERARVHTLPTRSLALRGRPTAAGKFLAVGGEKLWVRGVTYGTFRPNSEGMLLPERDVVARDFAAMAVHGIDAIRVYTLPPRWLLDLAAANGIRVLVGFDWPVHVAFLETRKQAREIEATVREGARALAGHEAILAWSLGNEIPGPVARWHGRRRIERFLAGLTRR